MLLTAARASLPSRTTLLADAGGVSAAQAAAQAIAKSYASALATATSVAHAFAQPSADVEALTKCWVLVSMLAGLKCTLQRAE